MLPFWQEFLPLKTVDIKMLCFAHINLCVNNTLWQVLAEMAEIFGRFGRFYFPAWQKFLPKISVHGHPYTHILLCCSIAYNYFKNNCVSLLNCFFRNNYGQTCATRITVVHCNFKNSNRQLYIWLSVATKNFILLITACRICTRLSVVPCSRLAFRKIL